MKFVPMLFSTEMVQAILAGRKTQTRRIVKFPNYHPSILEKQLDKLTVKDNEVFDGNNESIGKLRAKYGNVGDVLWVRESFHYVLDAETLEFLEYGYKATRELHDKKGKWKPSIHMPKDACRLFLKIKDIRIERLHDISEKAAVAEGIKFHYDEIFKCNSYKHYTMNAQHHGDPEHDYPSTVDPKKSFQSLWHKINGPTSWVKNPWVWVIEFERIEKPNKFC